MHGQIALESRPDTGTVATFSIPFNKPQFLGSSTPLVDLGAVPERLRSDLSLSCDNSSQGGNFATATSTPFHSPKHKTLPSINAEKGSAGLPFKTALDTIPAFSKAQHILVVEDNAINQQIALRTIKNLGYTVSAVWNGQEALEYLLKATQNSTTPDATNGIDHYLLPSLILMDIQMPVLDGYRATHTLRHHAPYKSNTLIQHIPIVAMTASAIQGDREKCQRAGMNDYLAKPVKRVTLEKMIHKWVSSENQLGGEVTSMESTAVDCARPDLSRNGGTEGSHRSSNCPGVDYEISEARTSGMAPASRRMSNAQSSLSPMGIAQGENASDRGQRLAAAAEMAASLRDAKLVNMATETDDHGASSLNGSSGNKAPPALVGGHVHQAYSNQHGTSLALTEENMEKLNAEPVDDRARMLQATPTAAGRPQQHMPDTLATPIEPLDAISVPVIAVSEDLASSIISSTTKSSPTKSRRGQLSAADRKRSDWSNASTVKPPQE